MLFRSKKVAGITKLENALKNLDKMINEEVPIVIAEMLKVIYSVNKRVEMVDEKVQIGIEGAHTVLTSPQTSLLKNHLDGKKVAIEAKTMMQQAADNLDDVKRSSSVPSSPTVE